FLGHWGLVKLSRWARTLSQARRVSALHCHVISQAIQVFLDGDPAQPPKDLHALLEILIECLIEQGEAVSLATARSFLEKIKTSGKTARLVRELLQLKEHPQPGMRRDVLVRALERRIERGENWAQRAKVV